MLLQIVFDHITSQLWLSETHAILRRAWNRQIFLYTLLNSKWPSLDENGNWRRVALLLHTKIKYRYLSVWCFLLGTMISIESIGNYDTCDDLGINLIYKSQNWTCTPLHSGTCNLQVILLNLFSSLLTAKHLINKN